MSRIKRGWELTKKSWGVLRGHPALIRFPLYGGVLTLVMTVIVIGPGLYLIEDGELAPGAPLVVIGFFLLAIIGTYFSVGLAAAAGRIFRGEEASVGDGLAVARANFGAVVGWALLSATVGLLFSLLENQGVIGQIIGRLLNVAWSLVTFSRRRRIAIEAWPIRGERRISLFTGAGPADHRQPRDRRRSACSGSCPRCCGSSPASSSGPRVASSAPCW